MKKFVLVFFLFLSCGGDNVWAQSAAETGMIPFPVFLKQGYSSIIEFEEEPEDVVLGDQQGFQIERLKKSIVIKAKVPYASANVFVYFKTLAPKLLILTASEDSNPTYHHHFTEIKPKVIQPKEVKEDFRKLVDYPALRILQYRFDAKKDYLTVVGVIQNSDDEVLRPKWALIRLKIRDSVKQDRILEPKQIWSERREIQKDSAVKFRLVFVKANAPRDLNHSQIIVPIDGNLGSLSATIRGAKR